MPWLMPHALTVSFVTLRGHDPSADGNFETFVVPHEIAPRMKLGPLIPDC